MRRALGNGNGESQQQRCNMAVKVIGLDRITRRLKELPEGATKAVTDELIAGANDIRNDAIARVPVDEGLLKNSIVVNRPPGKSGAEVVVNAVYGGYVEFGTGKKVRVPSRYQAIAQQVKQQGKRGDINDFVKSMMGWVRRKGLAGTYSVKTKRRLGNKAQKESQDLKLAKFLVFKILQNGIKAQPFFFPAFERNEKKIFDAARRALSNYIRKK